METVTVTGHSEARAALHLEVPPAVGYGWQPGGIGWLRANVARFSSGAAHERRRGLVAAGLSTVDAVALRKDAFARTTAMVGESTVDVMAAVARRVPVEVLANALGLPGASADAVAFVATVYPTGGLDTPAVRAALDSLIAACGGVPDEATAARIGLLVQACDATAGLIGNALLATVHTDAETDAVVLETLRHNPPVRVTRRTAVTDTQFGWTRVAAGSPVTVDLAAANHDPAVFDDPARFDPARAGNDRHLTFGAGPHACPGAKFATAIAAGVVDALRGCTVLTANVEHEPSPNLRIPARLDVRP